MGQRTVWSPQEFGREVAPVANSQALLDTQSGALIYDLCIGWLRVAEL